MVRTEYIHKALTKFKSTWVAPTDGEICQLTNFHLKSKPVLISNVKQLALGQAGLYVCVVYRYLE